LRRLLIAAAFPERINWLVLLPTISTDSLVLESQNLEPDVERQRRTSPLEKTFNGETRTEVARGSTGKFPGTRKTISWSLASTGSAVALSDGELSKYVIDADGDEGAVGDGDALADSDEFGSGLSNGAGAVVVEAELSGSGFPLRTSAIEGAI
jgi:hypothetical protein